MADPYNPPTPSQKQAVHDQAAYRQQQIDKQNAELQQTRQQAPGSLQAGSPQESQVRQSAASIEQQQLTQQNIKQVGSSPDQFAQARQDALKSGSFNYGSVGFASKGVPASYVDKFGTRITRPQGGITGGGATPGSVGITKPVSSPIIPTKPTPKPGGESLGFSDLVNIQVTRGGTTTPTIQAPVIQISQASLERTNQLRALQGLPPLQQVASLQVVKGTQTLPTKPTPKTGGGPPDLRSQLAALQGKAAESAKVPTEAVPFLSLTNPLEVKQGAPIQVTSSKHGKTFTETRTPISIGLKEEPKGTSAIPYTSFLDALQFVPFGGVGIKAAGEAARGAGSLSGKVILKGGETIIPKGVKPTEEKTVFDTVREMFSKPTATKETAKPLEPSMQRVSLGTGIGREVSTGEKGTSSLTGTKPGGRPPTTPTPKTISAGKGLEQIVKEKEVPKTTSKTEQVFEKTKQESKPATKAEQATQDYLNKLKGKAKGRLEEPGTIPIFIPKPPGTKQKTEQELVPIPYIPGPTTTLAPPALLPKQKEKERVGITDLLTTKLGTSTGTTEQTSITDIVQTQKTSPKQATDQTRISDVVNIYKEGGPGEPTGGGSELLGGGLGSGIPGFLDKVSKSGATRVFTGNVPISDIVGVYKREEVSYNERPSSSSTRESKSNLLGIFSTKKSSSKRLI